MTLSERDLRDALAPLAGDPVADARRILAALPAGPGPGPVPPVGWWLLGLGMVLGVLTGLGLRSMLGVAEPDSPAVTEPEQQQPAKDPPPKPSDPLMDRDELVYLMAFGAIRVDEPGVGNLDLEPGMYEVRAGTLVRTDAESRAGLHVFASDARVRLDHETVARILADTTELEHGRIWVDSGQRGTQVNIRTDLATVVLHDAKAIAIRNPEGVAVIAAAGSPIVRTDRGQTAQLSAGKQVWVDPQRGLSNVQDVGFLGTSTSWMTEMLLLQQDDAELRERVRDMVSAYEQGDHREPAALEIRRLGTRTIALLVESVQRQAAADPDYARATAALAGDVLQYNTAEWMFPLLEADDPELRVIAFRSLRRATGLDGRRPGEPEDRSREEFWRDASTLERRAAVTTWKSRVR